MLQKLHHAIHHEPDIVKSCRLYKKFEAASQNNATVEYTALIADLEHEMTEQEDTTTKEPRLNNLEEAKGYQKQTKKALQKFTERIQSFDRYQHQSAYEFYVHDMLNELLHTDNSYYKNAEIQPVLDTIHDKMCKFVLQPDDIDEQLSQQQSPHDIPEAEEIKVKLAEIKDMEELDERSVKSITGLFITLQMCHENSTKMAGHLVQLDSTLTPKQYTYIMKHSLCPLIQLSLSSHLCSPADLKFSKLHLTPEEIGVNQCLSRPFHLALAVLALKHPTPTLQQLSTQSCRDICSTAKKVPQPSLKNSKSRPRNYMKDLQGSGMRPDKTSLKQKKLHEKLQRLHHQPHQPHQWTWRMKCQLQKIL